MEKTDYIVDRWYKTKAGSYVKYLETLDGIFKSSEEIMYDDKIFTINKGSFGYASNKNNFTLLTDLNEIQVYLPEGHPDKIKPFLAGRYIKALVDNAECSHVIKGNYYLIVEEDRNTFGFYTEKSYNTVYHLSKNLTINYKLMPIDYNPNIQTDEELLLEEAKKRYIPGTKFESALNDKNPYIGIVVEGMYLEGKNRIWNGDSVGFLYENGKWAEIVEDKEVIPEYVKCIKNYGTHKVGEIFRTDTKQNGLTWEDCLIRCKNLNVFYKPSTWEAYAPQEGLNDYPLTSKECINTFEKTEKFIFEAPYVNREIEVGDYIQYEDKNFYTVESNNPVTLYHHRNNTSNNYYCKDLITLNSYKKFKIIKKALNNTKKVDFSSPKVTNTLYIKPRNKPTVVTTEEKRKKLKLTYSKTIKTKQHVN